jgi:hypothetical protein
MLPERAAAIMAVYEKAELFDELSWHVVVLPRTNEVKEEAIAIKLYAQCNDLFVWASADFEEIKPEDLPLLQQCLIDLQYFEAEYYLGLLFAARKRKMRPRPTFHPEIPQIQAFFDICGPEREES